MNAFRSHHSSQGDLLVDSMTMQSMPSTSFSRQSPGVFRQRVASSSGHNKRARKQRNIVILGFSNVGKTALCLRFAKNRFEEYYMPTMENNFVKGYRYKGQDLELSIKDTQGLSDQEYFRNEYCLGYHGYVLVYSVDDRRSLEQLKSINLKLVNLTHNHVPRVLVGNKSDLSHRREVSSEEGRALAEMWHAAFVESSAKVNNNVELVFQRLLDEVDSMYEPEPASFAVSDIPRQTWRMVESSLDWDYVYSYDLSSLDWDYVYSYDLEALAQWLIIITLLIGVTGLVAGIALLLQGGHEAVGPSVELGWSLGLVGIVVTVISALAHWGLQTDNNCILKVYVLVMGSQLLLEALLWIFRLRRLDMLQRHVVGGNLFSAVLALIELTSMVVVWLAQGYPNHSPEAPPSPFPNYDSFTEWERGP
eukprot:g5858.t1